MHKAQRLINHVALVLDGSSSMHKYTKTLIDVADEQVRHLALRSEEYQQETRVSVYLFADRVDCLIFDMDVMRLPSIKELYKANGMTALIDATLKADEDLRTTSQLYGDHAFLSFTLTDGAENRSRHSGIHLEQLFRTQEENWTTAFLVPGSTGEAYLRRFGVPAGNIAQWDTASVDGVREAISTIRTATDNFMVARSSGVRGTRSLFSTGVEAVNKSTVTSNLKPLERKAYTLVPVDRKARIDDFINGAGYHYRVGMGYYELTKTENIQPQKDIIVVDKRTDKAYSGRAARDLIGLPNNHVRVKPDHNPDYSIFVQSTSVNRNLMPHTRVLVKS